MYTGDVPVWFQSLEWSPPVEICEVVSKRNLLPRAPGLYVFSNSQGEWDFGKRAFRLIPGPAGGNLYVGMTEKSLLRYRLKAYLVSPEKVKVSSTSLAHAGKAQLLVKIQQHARLRGGATGEGIWLRWAAFERPSLVEGALIQYLRPAYNSRMEKVRLGPGDSLP